MVFSTESLKDRVDIHCSLNLIISPVRLAPREPPVAQEGQMAVHPSSCNVAERLALAMVALSDAPLLLLDGDLRIVACSTSFDRADL
jgi:hypothetical protein